jgi:O-antigen/teichoic acid export membrane protein
MLDAGVEGSDPASDRQPGPRRVARDIGGQLVLRVLNVALGLVVTVVLARSLGSSGFGEWSTIMAVVGIAGVVGELGLEQVAVKRIASEPEQESRWLGALVLVKLALGVTATALSAVVVAAIASTAQMRVAGLVLALTLPLAAATSVRVAFQLRVRNAFTAGVELLYGIAWATVIVVVAATDGGLLAYAAGFLAVTAVMAGVQLAAGLRLVSLSLRSARAHSRMLIRLGVPVAVATVLMIAYGRIDQILVFKLNGAHAAGLYGAAYRVMDRAILIPGTVMATLFPLMAAAHGRDDARLRRLAQVAIDVLAAASLPALAFALAAAAPAMATLFGHEFAAAGPALAVLMGAYVLICFGYPFGFLVVVLSMQRRLARIALLGLVVNVVANVLLLPHYGFTAAAWVTLATELVVIGLNVRAVLPAIGMRIDVSRLARITLAAGGMGASIYGLRRVGVPFGALLGAAPVIYAVLLAATGGLDTAQLRLLARQEPA